MRACALTDTNNMFGTVQFHQLLSGSDVKPIVGAELNITAGDRKDPSARDVHHVLLLAENQQGYQNLVRLVSLGWVEGLHAGVPRIDFELLRRHSEGLIGLSACMGGWLAQTILMRGTGAGREAMAQLAGAFEKGSFFIELQDHGFPENGPLNQVLVELARELELPIVATNDCHFVAKEQSHAQVVLQCIGSGQRLAEVQAIHHGSSEMHLKSAGEMTHLFRHVPESIQATLQIAERCAGQVSPFSKPKLPRFPVPQGLTEAQYLSQIARAGLETRFEELRRIDFRFEPKAYFERLELELRVIANMGFPGYFLIVQDFINWGKHNGVPVGPGRGSGAGSLVAWALRITNLDPIPHGLLFERFLNPERVSMPDFDVDFCMEKRDLVIDYVRETYGHQSVGQIATFHQLKSRSVVRDVGRVMGMSPGDAGRIATMIPEPIQGKSVPIEKALAQEQRLRAVYDEDHAVKELIDTAQALENVTRHAGMHAAGVVISEGPIWDHVPVFCPEAGTYVTQFHKDDVESAGLVKFDFLGLKTLTVLDIAVELIRRRPGRDGDPFELDTLPTDDPATFALLQSGETTNVFQLESSGMQSLFKQLKPDCFEDIVAAVALYRPGPMGAGMDKDFVERRHGRQKVEYPHPSIEHILEPTRGVIVYQEQVMQIARDMAGYTLGGADLLRRAMGKKKAEEMAKQKAIFVEGALKNGHSEADAVHVFDLMAYFAGYGFNKSHSAAYALITYQTAYLKTHYPVEFQCATLTADRDKSEKVVRTVAEARSMGITVLPPDVNESEINFSVVYSDSLDGEPRKRATQPVCLKGKLRDPRSPKIRFGLGALKGVGEAALEAVFEARTYEGNKQPFSDLFEFCARVDLRRVNKGVVEALVQSGAFDSVHEPLEVTRAQAFAAIEAAIERGKKISNERSSGQTNLFGLLEPAPAENSRSHTGLRFPSMANWDSRDQLAREKSTLGFYVSGHPLDRYTAELSRFCESTIDNLRHQSEGTRLTVGGLVEGFRERNTKMGKMAFFFLEDAQDRVEVKVFSKALGNPDNWRVLNSSQPVVVSGTVRHERDRNADSDAPQETKLILTGAQLLSDAIQEKVRQIHLRMDIERISTEKLESLRHMLSEHPGSCRVSMSLASRNRWSVELRAIPLQVAPTDTLISELEQLFGEKVCELR